MATGKFRLEIRENGTGVVDHVIATDRQPGSAGYDKMLDGLYNRLDLDRFYVEEPYAFCIDCHQAVVPEEVNVNGGPACPEGSTGNGIAWGHRVPRETYDEWISLGWKVS